MDAKVKQDMLLNAGWFSGVFVALGAIIGASAARLSAEKSDLVELQNEVAHKEENLRQQNEESPGAASLSALESTLTKSVTMIESESRRVSQLSDAAREAGVILVAIKSLDKEYSEDGSVVSVTHELGATGSYRELGRFFDALYRSPGTIGVEEFSIEREEDASGSELQASISVTWYARGPGAAAASALAEANR